MTSVLSSVRRGLVVGLLLLVAHGMAAGQDRVWRANSYTPADDVEFGQQAAAAVFELVDPVTDPKVDDFVARMVRRLSDAIPAELRQPTFRYEVSVLDTGNVTSFAFPGGPVFISAGIIELANSEDALAGLLAHELAHVVLRHATGQLSASEQYQIGAINGRQIGLAAASPTRGILERGANFSIASYFLRFDPVLDVEADVLGAQLTERAGYDPDAVDDMFQQLRTAGAAHGGLTWLMRHPHQRTEPGDHAVGVPSAALRAAQAKVGAIRRPEQRMDAQHAASASVGTVGVSVPSPQGEVSSVTAGDQLQLTVPANWRRLLVGNTVTFAPERAYVALPDRPTAITHGFQVGVARSITGELEGDMSTLLNALAHNNPKLTWVPAFQTMRVADRDAITTTASHVSPVTHDFEIVTLTVLRLSNESFLYFIGVAPQPEASTYRGAFDRAIQSLTILE